MKQNYTSLMALAMAGILAPAAQAASYVETTDYSSTGTAPTTLGAFDPAVDFIIGTLNPLEGIDAMLVTATPGASVTMPYAITGTTFPNFGISIYDNGNFGTFLTSGVLNPPGGTANSSLSFTVPVDGNYMIYMERESVGTISYTIGTVPEPTSTALLAAAAAGAAALRRRKTAPRTA